MEDESSETRWHITAKGHRYLSAAMAPDWRPHHEEIRQRVDAAKAEAHVEYDGEPMPDYEAGDEVGYAC